MVRSGERAREMAIRSALGAAKHRLIRQLFTESALLSVVGGAAGVSLAYWMVKCLPLLSKDARFANLPLDPAVLLFALGATLVTCLLFGVAPAIRAARVDANGALKTGVRGGLDRSRAAAQQVLVAGEVALCVVLLVGAGLLFASFRRVLAVDPGFRTENLLTMRIGLPDSYETVAAVNRFYSPVPERLGSLPGVSGAALVTSLPIAGGEANGDITIEGRATAPGEEGAGSFRRISPNYFRVMGIPLVRGREFDQHDDGLRGKAMIVSENMARRFWPGGDPIGARIKIGPAGKAPWATIVGVVKDVQHVGLDVEPSFATYEPLAQAPWSSVELAVRAAGDPASVTSAVRNELRSMESALVIDRVETMTQRIGESVAPRRLNLILFGLFAGLALLLAAVGLYGVVAYAASQRTREFGIRIALGARPSDVLRLVLAQGARLAVAGVIVGIGAAMGLARLLTGLLFGVSPADPATIATVSAVMLLVALAACWLPAHRATQLAPTEALRSE
jgi:predicted permease